MRLRNHSLTTPEGMCVCCALTANRLGKQRKNNRGEGGSGQGSELPCGQGPWSEEPKSRASTSAVLLAQYQI